MPEKQYVTFYSPGTFVSETTSREIDSWDVEKACEMAHSVSERYGATPYAFQFTTRGRNESEFASRVIRTSPRYWLGGKVEALAEVEARATERDSILLANMRGNGWGKIITNSNSFSWTAPFEDGKDVRLDWTPRQQKREATDAI